MDDQQVIYFFQEKINEIYRRENLQSLSMGGSYEYNSHNLLSWYYELIRKLPLSKEQDWKAQQIFDDLVFCSDELLYFTAQLFLYRPYIDNPLDYGHQYYGTVVYPNIQNIEGKRYNMCSDVAYQKAYNYWDRVGDLFALCFPVALKDKFLGFNSVIDKVNSIFPNSENFIWLKKFKENEFVAMNKFRKQIVHFITPNTAFKYSHLENSSNEIAIEEIQKQRLEIADYFKNHSRLMIEGFVKSLALLEEYILSINSNPQNLTGQTS